MIKRKQIQKQRTHWTVLEGVNKEQKYEYFFPRQKLGLSYLPIFSPRFVLVKAVFSRWGGNLSTHFFKQNHELFQIYIYKLLCLWGIHAAGSPFVCSRDKQFDCPPGDKHFSNTGAGHPFLTHVGDKLSFYTGGETLLSHSGGGQTFLYTGGGRFLNTR